ncbi:hypothetical protein CALVIDRAFT_566398 [Calocera viscosa TUFC12733]|uniref:Uncharacterized protein n=1 Tax=Calocera viscosa (strain TUFC12733) TaxID=1330018 RepID=A0A167JJS7_CALVF|nr:hypothetical protein CALVIDRAFT_566398 [Calocera viscosa TUFC12733]
MDLTFFVVAICCSVKFELAVLGGGVAWIVTGCLMLAGMPNCNTGSAWFNSLIPSSPHNGASLEHTAYVKCVFSGFQLANGAIHLLIGA